MDDLGTGAIHQYPNKKKVISAISGLHSRGGKCLVPKFKQANANPGWRATNAGKPVVESGLGGDGDKSILRPPEINPAYHYILQGLFQGGARGGGLLPPPPPPPKKFVCWSLKRERERERYVAA